MGKSILQQLYDGEVYPAENISVNNPNLQKMNDTIMEEKERLIASLSDSDNEILQNVEDLQNESAAIYGYECFTHGFKLAARLLVESLGDTECTTSKADS